MMAMPKSDFILSATLAAALMLCLGYVCAERDFNFNDSQVPLLEPKDEPTHARLNQDPYALEALRCHYTDSEILLSLVLKNHDWQDLSDNKRAKVLDKLSKFFAIPKEFIVMESVTKREMYEMQKESIRKGNNKCHSSRHLGRVNLMLGCGSSYFTMGEPIANQIGQQMKDGSIDNITGEKFGWWIIWHKEAKIRSERSRRQVEGSGEDDYDDDYEYDDDEDPVDSVTEIPPVTTHAHRHHHGVAKPDLTESKLELTNNRAEEDVDKPKTPTDSDSKLLLLNNKNGNIDEEIVESVSQLESVITKTIENTKNIKELPVVVVEEEEDDDGSTVVEIEKELESPNILEELSNELERKTGEKTHLSEFELSTRHSLEPHIAAASATSTTLKSVNLDDDALETSVPLNRNLNADVGINSLGSPVNVAEVIESTAASSTVTVGLEKLSPTTTTTAATITITSTTTTLPPPPPLPLSTLLTTNTSTTTTTPLSQSPQSPYSPFDASSASASYSSASSSSSSSSFLSTTTPPSATTMQTKQQHKSSDEDISTMLPMNSVDDAATKAVQTTPITTWKTNSSLFTTNTVYNVLTTTTTTTTTQTRSGAYELATASPSHITDDVVHNEGKKDENEPTTLLPEHDQDVNHLAPTTTPQPVDSYDTSSSLPAYPTTPIATTVTTPTTPETTTSTIASTDYVEPKVENTPPMIKTRLQKFAVTSGKSFAFHVPDETFYDSEDITNLRLELTDKDGHELKTTSWLQFNAETREIYGLPLDDAVSKWQYRLSATDSGNETVTETVEMSVQQHRGVRSVNHEINIAVKINEKNMHNIDWQMKLMRAIAATLGDESSSSIVVREIRQTPQDANAATFVYFNETLPTTECPEAELNNLVKRLDAGRLSDLVNPTLGVKSITGQLIGPCQKSHIAKPKPTTHMTKNLPPMPRNQVDRVNATVGHLLVYKVPSDTFYDPNDNELTLTLKTKDNKDLKASDWLQFDSKNEEFFGIPKSGDIGSEEYLLKAEDAGGLSATDALVVVVNHASKRELSVYFKAYLAIRHALFNADLQRKFVERIAQLFGDHSTNFVQIRSVTTDHDSDGTIVNFYNTTLYKTPNRCPEEEIKATTSVYLNQDHLRDRVKKALGPELNLTHVQVLPLGSCHQSTDVAHAEFIPTKTEEPSLKSTFTDEYMFTFILPAVIIVVMIVIASIIACCLHRRRRKSGKMELGDEEERKSFRTKGIPVIFQDELDEKPEIGNKSPIILKDEKPPLLPPSYNTSNMNGDNDVDEYVPPPAVVVGGREVRGKSPATPSYRKPPPYVSP